MEVEAEDTTAERPIGNRPSTAVPDELEEDAATARQGTHLARSEHRSTCFDLGGDTQRDVGRRFGLRGRSRRGASRAKQTGDDNHNPGSDHP
jgi:hypothetical protein